MPPELNAARRMQIRLQELGKRLGGRAKKRIKANVSGGILQSRSGKAASSVFSKTKKLGDGGLLITMGFPPRTAWYMRFFEISGSKIRRAGRGTTVDRVTGERRKTRALRIPIGGGQFIFRKTTRGFARRPVIMPAVQAEVKSSEDELLDELEEYALEAFPARIGGVM